MEFIDLGRQYQAIKPMVDKAIRGVLDAHAYISGPEVGVLEEQLADFCGRKHCVACGSGTEALQIPLMMYGVGPGDAVFVPSFTFFSTAECVSLVGATPVFVEVDASFNIDCDDLENKIAIVEAEGSLRPRGIISVDLFGRSADYDRIEPLAKEHDLFLLEDAAQGFGGALRGKRNGSFGDVSATSFFPAKPLGCYGDGGAMFTDDDGIYALLKSIREHGKGADKYDNERIGINGRLDTLQAAILIEKLAIFEEELERRQWCAERYTKNLASCVMTPLVDDAHYSAWAQYTIRLNDTGQRARVQEELSEAGIPSMIYYPIPLHQQRAYALAGRKPASLPFTEEISCQVLSLPMHPYLEGEEIDRVSDIVMAAVRR